MTQFLDCKSQHNFFLTEKSRVSNLHVVKYNFFKRKITEIKDRLLSSNLKFDTLQDCDNSVQHNGIALKDFIKVFIKFISYSRNIQKVRGSYLEIIGAEISTSREMVHLMIHIANVNQLATRALHHIRISVGIDSQGSLSSFSPDKDIMKVKTQLSKKISFEKKIKEMKLLGLSDKAIFAAYLAETGRLLK